MKTFVFYLSVLILLCGCASRQVSLHSQTAHNYGKRAFDSFNSGDFSDALLNYNQAFRYAGLSDEPLLKAQYLFNIGRIHFEMDHFDSAANYFSASLKEFSFYGDSADEASAAAWLVMCYAYQGDFDNAELLRKTAVFQRNRLNKHFWYTVLARLEIAQTDYDEASLLLDSASIPLKKRKDKELLSMNCFYRGLIAGRQGRLQDSRLLLDSSLALSDGLAATYRRWKILLELSKVSYCLDLNSEAAQRYYYRSEECRPTGVKFPEISEISDCMIKKD
ncbi:MAG TPA: hypothetical protein VHP36_01845 [Chitinispirillaceae bacterium]|nr:hypothetical protein [Chitinispirillaceae bacterium]